MVNMSVFTAAIHPGKSVGFLVLGASIHDILTRLKAEPQLFSILDLTYDPNLPITEPVVLTLPENGIRLRFDGQKQTLRLIEIVDFTKSKLTYNNKDIVKSAVSDVGGPEFRHVYSHLMGPAFPGEYTPPATNDKNGYGIYVHSYPGLAFTFPVLKSAWTDGKDHVELLSSSATLPATSMAVFYGDSWPDVRNNLFTADLPDPRSLLPSSKVRESYADEVGAVKILGAGLVEMKRPRAASSFLLRLGKTTPQDLVAELGPPDAIYRKSDQRMMIHKARTGSETSQGRPRLVQDDSTDTDHSSTHNSTDLSEDESEDQPSAQVSSECFYNYFFHGFDIMVSNPAPPSRVPPSQAHLPRNDDFIENSAPLVATKLILHGNVPGSYSFNRHRRSRWEISYLPNEDANSETHFDEIAKDLHEEWKSIYASEEEAKQRERGMVLNRGWGNSPGSSCELLGGWEDSAGGRRVDGGYTVGTAGTGLGNTTLFGFPGLVFEVLKNGCVSSLTVF